MKQTSFFPEPELFFGGALQGASRQAQRPLSSSKPIHLVLKSTSFNLFRNKELILERVNKYAKLFGITCYGVTVQKDHIHLVVRLLTRSYADHQKPIESEFWNPRTQLKFPAKNW